MKRITLAACIALAVFTGACAKKKIVVQSPPTPSSTPNAATPDAPKPIATVQRPATTNIQTAAPAKPDVMTTKERADLNAALGRLEDAMFDYDKSTIRNDAAKTLGDDVAVIRTTLARFPGERITIEGHCDQRGSDEYNMALGERRAQASKEFLVNMGISGGQLATITYGKERPQCNDNSEECYQRNRRAHLTANAR